MTPKLGNPKNIESAIISVPVMSRMKCMTVKSISSSLCCLLLSGYEAISSCKRDGLVSLCLPLHYEEGHSWTIVDSHLFSQTAEG